jgi:long-chain fatty acid transport protein
VLRTAAPVLVATACALVPALAQAGGFYVPEIGPRAVGMAGAVVADPRDTSAIFHNPAGLAGQRGTQVQVAGSMFFGNVQFYRRPTDNPQMPGDQIRFDRVRNTNKIGGAPLIAVASDFGVRDLSVGLGVYAPFGAGLEFPQNGAQRHIVTAVHLRTIYVTPTVAYRIFDRFSFGVGLSYVYADLGIDQVNAVPFVTGDPEQYPDPDPAFEGTTQLRGRDPASFSATIGLRFNDLAERFSFGASVMVPTKLKLQGKATVRNAGVAPLLDPESGDELQPAGSRKDDMRVFYPLPLVVRLGAAVRPHERVLVELDYNFQRWSTFDTLTVEFARHHALLDSPGAFMYDVVLEPKWKNSHTVRLGMDAMPGDPARVPLSLRAGVLYDQSPIDDRHFDVLAPDSDKIGISLGLAYAFRLGRRVQLDAEAGFMHLFFRERTVAPETVGADFSGEDDDASGSNDSMDNGLSRDQPGSDRTILNKPAPSFHHGVTRVFFDILGVGLTLRV